MLASKAATWIKCQDQDLCKRQLFSWCNLFVQTRSGPGCARLCHAPKKSKSILARQIGRKTAVPYHGTDDEQCPGDSKWLAQSHKAPSKGTTAFTTRSFFRSHGTRLQLQGTTHPLAPQADTAHLTPTPTTIFGALLQNTFFFPTESQGCGG